MVRYGNKAEHRLGFPVSEFMDAQSVTDLKASLTATEPRRPEHGVMSVWLRWLLALAALLLAAAVFLAYDQTGLVFDLFSLRYCG